MAWPSAHQVKQLQTGAAKCARGGDGAFACSVRLFHCNHLEKYSKIKELGNLLWD